MIQITSYSKLITNNHFGRKNGDQVKNIFFNRLSSSANKN